MIVSIGLTNTENTNRENGNAGESDFAYRYE